MDRVLKKRIKRGECLSDMDEMCLISSKSRWWFRIYLRNNQLSKEAQLALLNPDNLAFFKIYLKNWWLSEIVQCELIALENEVLFDTYLKSSKCFDNTATEMLLHLEDKKWFKTYINEHELSQKQQVKLVEMGDMELFEAYVQKHIMCGDPLLKILLGPESPTNTALFDIYTDYWTLENREQLELISTKKLDLFKTYVQKHRLTLDARHALYNTLDFEWLRAYLMAITKDDR
ncbi:MAG: hypothetical protein J6X42_03965 [Alphaproteobacteria bacterium]|nr:hypothetical protein [Alphaproteobacteria bacterium]